MSGDSINLQQVFQNLQGQENGGPLGPRQAAPRLLSDLEGARRLSLPRWRHHKWAVLPHSSRTAALLLTL